MERWVSRLQGIAWVRRRWRALVLGAVVLLVGGPVIIAGASAVVLDVEFHAVTHDVGQRNVPALTGSVDGALWALRGLDVGVHGLVWLNWLPPTAPTYQAVTDLLAAGVKTAAVGHAVLDAAGSQSATATHGMLAGLPRMVATLNNQRSQLLSVQQDLQRMPTRGVWSPIVHSIGPWTPRAVTALKWVRTALPRLNQAVPQLMGALGFPSTQRYLLIFQNSGEMRATGGFMTAYSVLQVHRGVLGPIHVHNIYSLQQAIKYRPPAPGPIAYEFGLQHWHLRDANTSPNVPTSVQTIYRFWNSIPHHPVLNGVIFVNVWVVDAIIRVLGKVAVQTPYYHVVLTPQNANVEMEYLAERAHYPRPGLRKQFLSVLAHDVLARVAHGPSVVKWGALQALGSALRREWILMYFNAPGREAWVKRLGWGGTVQKHTGQADYLQVVDENLGGHKDNFFLQEHVSVQIKALSPHHYVQVTTVTLDNPALYDGWLVWPYSGLVRLYVPSGAQLLDLDGSAGFSQNHVNGTLNKTVLGGFMVLGVRRSLKEPPPLGTLTVVYQLPFQTLPRHLIFQEQPGSRGVAYTVVVGGYRRQFVLRQSLTLTLPNGLQPAPYHVG